jgi:hypothetical protein
VLSGQAECCCRLPPPPPGPLANTLAAAAAAAAAEEGFSPPTATTGGYVEPDVPMRPPMTGGDLDRVRPPRRLVAVVRGGTPPLLGPLGMLPADGGGLGLIAIGMVLCIAVFGVYGCTRLMYDFGVVIWRKVRVRQSSALYKEK